MRNFAVSHPETGGGLEKYLKEDAFMDEMDGAMRTYLVWHRFTGECAGYFSLKAGLIAINERVMPDNSIAFDTMPGVELANFAVNGHFQRKMKLSGLGGVLFRRLIVPFVLMHAETLGIYMIYLFALPYPKLLETYTSYGFQRLPSRAEDELHQRIKPAYDESCIFMFQALKHLKG